MNTKQLIIKQIEELNKQLKEIEEQEKVKVYQEIKYKREIYRIYNWENKQFKDFPMPEDFEWCPYFDFVELINNKVFDMQQYPICYYCKNQCINNKEWVLARLCLGRSLGVYSNNDDLADSDSDGRVVVRKVKE